MPPAEKKHGTDTMDTRGANAGGIFLFLPSFCDPRFSCGAMIFYRERDSAVPFPRQQSRRILLLSLYRFLLIQTYQIRE